MHGKFAGEPGRGGRYDQVGKGTLCFIAAVAVLLAMSFGHGVASAQTGTEGDAEARKSVAQASMEDFVVAFMDFPSGNILKTDIRAGGFDGNASPRFPEKGVSSTNDGPQLTPDVAMASNGDFVVVWADDSDGNGYYEILARGYHSAGALRFHTFTVNTVSTGNQIAPAIAMTPEGDFVIAWQDDRDENDIYQIHARGFHSDGSQKFATITVNTIATGEQRNPTIAMAPNGEFVVAWENDNSIDGQYNVLARGFHANGMQRFPWINVNTALPGDQRAPDIAMALNGEFVVTWQDDQDNNDIYQIYARGFHAQGTQRFSTMTVNSVAAGQQISPYIAMALNGDFVITWTDDQDGNGVNQVLARGFFRDGAERFHDFTVNSVAAGNQIVTDIAMDASGEFVIPWQDDQDGNDVYQILARGFHANGSQLIPVFTVNEVATGQQWTPTIATARQVPTIYLPYMER